MSTSDAYTDVVELCALLQCLGFSVKSLDTTDANMSHDGGTRTVVISCQTSGLHVVLESPSMSCSCPVQNEQNSGMWQVSGVAGGKQLDKEFGCTLLGSLPKSHRERLTNELREMIRCIKENNESCCHDKVQGNKDNKSASMTELKTPEKLLFNIKAETPTRYRSLDTLTSASNKELAPIPAPGSLQRAHVTSECDVDNGENKPKMVRRQSTYTLSFPSSTPGSSVRCRNKTSSPNFHPQNKLLDNLIAAEKVANDLCNKLSFVIQEFMDEDKNDSSLSSLALEVSKISEMKAAAESSKAQFASSPNLSGIAAPEDFPKNRMRRVESASTSNLALKSTPKEGKPSRLRRISPGLFRKTDKISISTHDKHIAKADKNKSQEGKSKMNFTGLFKPKIITPVRVPKFTPTPEPSPNLSSSRKKYSHIKSTIPRPAKKE